jgi:hypothetical protein
MGRIGTSSGSGNGLSLYSSTLWFGHAFATFTGMILLIWASERAQDCARAIEDTFQQRVHVAATLQEGCEHLQLEDYAAVLVDQWSTEVEPGQADYLFHHLGTAVPVFVNFGISGVQRVLRELRAAFNRQGRETMLARHNARLALRNELKDDVTALLLCCGLALEEPTLTEAAIMRLRQVQQAADQIKRKLALSEGDESAVAAGS